MNRYSFFLFKLYCLFESFNILGSDDSGIICPVSVTVPGSTTTVQTVARSRESLDSGAPDTNEEDTSSESKTSNNDCEKSEDNTDSKNAEAEEKKDEVITPISNLHFISFSSLLIVQ